MSLPAKASGERWPRLPGGAKQPGPLMERTRLHTALYINSVFVILDCQDKKIVWHFRQLAFGFLVSLICDVFSNSHTSADHQIGTEEDYAADCSASDEDFSPIDCSILHQHESKKRYSAEPNSQKSYISPHHFITSSTRYAFPSWSKYPALIRPIMTFSEAFDITMKPKRVPIKKAQTKIKYPSNIFTFSRRE
jgi:hypothetical protein